IRRRAPTKITTNGTSITQNHHLLYMGFQSLLMAEFSGVFAVVIIPIVSLPSRTNRIFSPPLVTRRCYALFFIVIRFFVIQSFYLCTRISTRIIFHILRHGVEYGIWGMLNELRIKDAGEEIFRGQF